MDVADSSSVCRNHGEGKEEEQDSDYDSMFGSSPDISAGGEDSNGSGTDDEDDYLDMFGASNGGEEAISRNMTSDGVCDRTMSSRFGTSASDDHSLTTDITSDDKKSRFRHDTNKSIPRKRKASVMMQTIVARTGQTDESNDSASHSVLLQQTSLESSTRSHKSSNVLCSSNHRATNDSSAIAQKMRPDQYKSYDMEDFWRSLRSWDFLADLNLSMKRIVKVTGRDLAKEMKGSNHDGKREVKSKLQPHLQPLPDKFHCCEQYIALWAPLLSRETKAQILSEISSTSGSVPWSKLISPVKVTAKGKMSNATVIRSDHLILEIESRTAIIPKAPRGVAPLPVPASIGINQADFSPNDLVLITCDPSVVEQASNGVLKVPDTPSSYSMTSLLSLASPFLDHRLGVVGVVEQRSRSLHTSGSLMVQVSRRLWKPSSIGVACDLFLIRLGSNVTAMREFRALCKMNEMSLSGYLLDPKFDHCAKPGGRISPAESTGSNALGIGFRIWVKSKFNQSQQGSINAATREYGDGGFTLIKGPPGTGKTTTLVALLNALHLRQYQKYYSEIERITLSTKASSQTATETLAAISAAAKVKPRILVCAPSNAAIDNVCLKIIEDRFLDGNGSKYSPPMIRIGSSASVGSLTLNEKVNKIISQGLNPKQLETAVTTTREELRRLQNEVRNLQLRIRLIAKASLYPISREWEIRIDEENFGNNQRVLFVNHKTKKVQLKCPPMLESGEEEYPIDEMPHYRGCMVALVKYIERHNDLHFKLLQYILLQNATSDLQHSKSHNDVGFDLNLQLETNVLDSTHIVMTTLGSSGSKILDGVGKFSVVVIDEAAQCSEPSILPALHRGSSHCVLLGDPAQLPATIFEVSGRKTKYDRSLFQRLEEAGHEVHLLDTQYRMHPKISSFPRRIFYQGGLTDGPNVCKSSYGGDLSIIIRSKFRHFQPFTMFDLDSTEERDGTNLSNSGEAQFALSLYQNLVKETNGLAKKSKIAIITPYLQQVSLIKRLFEEEYGLSYRQFLEISTIDSFQGKESSIVILSCVRAATPTYDDGRRSGIGFLSDVQRMNVALTRAKHFLFVITRCRTIHVNPYWKDLIGHAYAQHAILKVTMQNNGGGKTKQYGRASILNISSRRYIFPDLRNLYPISHLEVDHNRSKEDPQT